MGKTYEALERAEKEYENIVPVVKQDPVTKISLPIAARKPIHEMMDCYEVLKTNVKARNSDPAIKTILFCGTAHGNGTSTTAINFASTLARNNQIKVLLIEANLRTVSFHTVFRDQPKFGLSEIVTDGDKPIPYIKKVDPGNLWALTAGSKLSGPVNLFESDRFSKFLTSVRTAFDYVILDGPPAPIFSEAQVLCSKVDGVVLVVEAGKTREQVAVRAKKMLEDAGGKVLGVVLNKRKFQIPGWIYKRL